MSVAKGLGGGMPIGGFLAKQHAAVFEPGDHGSTFGGNPVSCAAGIAVAATAGAAEAPRAARPNIVYILADDLGYGDLGCYGQQQIATPNIDALARESLRFTQHYAGNSVCTPSRSSLLTGMHTGHTRHRDNPRFVDSYGFLPTQRTFADVMRSAGYVTAIAGKWHVGDRADTRDTASFHGFDFAYCVGYPYPDRGVEHWPSRLYTNGRETVIPENADARHGRYMDDLYTEAALRFIDLPSAARLAESG